MSHTPTKQAIFNVLAASAYVATHDYDYNSCPDLAELNFYLKLNPAANSALARASQEVAESLFQSPLKSEFDFVEKTHIPIIGSIAIALGLDTQARIESWLSTPQSQELVATIFSAVWEECNLTLATLEA